MNRKIKIISTQYDGNEKETVIVDTFAEITGDSKAYSINYVETQGDTAGENTLITVTDGKRLTVKRENGAMLSLIILEKGIRHVSNCTVSGQTFNMGMSASELYSDFENGILVFRYETDIELVPIGEIEFEFRFGKTEVKYVRDSQ